MDAKRLLTENRRWQAMVGLVLMLTVWLLAAPAHAQGIEVTYNQVRYRFAQQATFVLQANAEAEITDVYLFFKAQNASQTHSIDVPFEPGTAIDIEYVHDLRADPLSPFTDVSYWWRIEDASGAERTLEPQQFNYVDNRFQWVPLRQGIVTVYWIEDHGDPTFGQAALDIALASLESINAELRAPLPEAVEIYLYNTQQNLDAAMTMSGRDWAGGEAHPDLGVVVTAIPFNEFYQSRMKRYIPHELTHLLVYRAVTPSGYHHVPEWLDEGLATANERLPTPEHQTRLNEAVNAGELIPLADLCVPFSPNADDALLAYAQSGSVVRFIRETDGAPAVRALLAAYADGASCSRGVQQALDTSLSGLEIAWQASLQPEAPWRSWAIKVAPWAGLWVLGLLAMLPMIGRGGRR